MARTSVQVKVVWMWNGVYVPEGIADDEKYNIFGLRTSKDLVTVRLNHLTVSDYNRATIIRLLLHH